MTDRYTVQLIEDENGELALPLPDGLMEKMGWGEGDTLVWKDNKDGSYSMSKKEQTELVLVDCISTYRMRYLVEVPAGKTEWALDTVVCEEAHEFSQLHIGEQIMSHRVVTDAEAMKICDEDNSYCAGWADELKQKNFYTTWEYQTTLRGEE